MRNEGAKHGHLQLDLFLLFVGKFVARVFRQGARRESQSPLQHTEPGAYIDIQIRRDTMYIVGIDPEPTYQSTLTLYHDMFDVFEKHRRTH